MRIVKYYRHSVKWGKVYSYQQTSLLMLTGVECQWQKLKTYQDTEEVEVFCSTRVVSTLILELGISVQRVQVLLTKLQEKYEYQYHKQKNVTKSQYLGIFSNQTLCSLCNFMQLWCLRKSQLCVVFIGVSGLVCCNHKKYFTSQTSGLHQIHFRSSWLICKSNCNVIFIYSRHIIFPAVVAHRC